MSAAEKLRALGVVIESESQWGRTERAEAAEPFVRALPQILALVEAAEKTYDGWLAGDFDWDELVAALAALDAALSPPTGGSP